MKNLALCSNHKCDFHIECPELLFLFLEMDKNLDAESRAKNISEAFEKLPEKPQEKFCHLCGANLIYFCPSCKDATFTTPGQRFCGKCGASLKPSPYDAVTIRFED